jgi:hypothetical protein
MHSGGLPSSSWTRCIIFWTGRDGSGATGIAPTSAILPFTCGHQVIYWREEPLEVDGVSAGRRGKWALEVKTGGFRCRSP